MQLPEKMSGRFKALVKHGARSVTLKDGDTALLLAATTGHDDMEQMLTT